MVAKMPGNVKPVFHSYGELAMASPSVTSSVERLDISSSPPTSTMSYIPEATA
jgi:hypothetical protein